MDSYATDKEPCPVCRSLGRDTAGDNLIRYSDGHGYCFACGNFEPSLGFDAPRGARRAATYEGQLSALSHYWVERLGKLVGFDESHLLVARPRLADDGRIAYPIFDPLHEVRGHVLRGYDGQQPKALTYMTRPNDARCSWYRSDQWAKSSCVVLVEDIPSAVRVARWADCVALLGMPTARTMEEVVANADHVVWWLDDDMDYASVQYRTEYQIYFKTSLCILGQKDAKNMTDDEVRACLSAVSLVPA